MIGINFCTYLICFIGIEMNRILYCQHQGPFGNSKFMKVVEHLRFCWTVEHKVEHLQILRSFLKLNLFHRVLVQPFIYMQIRSSANNTFSLIITCKSRLLYWSIIIKSWNPLHKCLTKKCEDESTPTKVCPQLWSMLHFFVHLAHFLDNKRCFKNPWA